MLIDNHKQYHWRDQFKAELSKGNHNIAALYFLKFNTCKFIFFCFFSIITLGFLWLLSTWIPKFYRFMVFDYCYMNEASHLHLLTTQNDHLVIKLTKKKLCMDIRIQKLQGQNMWNILSGFDYNLTRFNYIQQLEKFIQLRFEYEDYLKEGLTSLTEQMATSLLELYGKCQLAVRIPSYLQLFIEEILTPFYIFQMLACVVWVLQQYYIYPIFLTIFSFFFSIYDIKLIIKNYQDLKKTQHNIIAISVKRNGQNKLLTSDLIVPGDIVKLEKNLMLPFDCLFFQGKAIMDEQKLTGNISPVVKQPYSNQLTQKEFVLYEGSTVLKTPSGECLVISTGYRTWKGQMIRSMLFPKNQMLNLYSQSLTWIFILLILTLLGSLIVFPKLVTRQNFFDLVIEFLDLITVTVPPSLPLAMTVGIGITLNFLKKQNIYCINPPKVVKGGLVKTVIFDKSGTLTEGFPQLICICENGVEKVDIKQLDVISLICLSCCCQVYFDQDNIPLGQNQNLQMYLFTKLKIESSKYIIFPQLQVKLIHPLSTNSHNKNIFQVTVLFQQKQYQLLRGPIMDIINLCQDKFDWIENYLSMFVVGYAFIENGRCRFACAAIYQQNIREGVQHTIKSLIQVNITSIISSNCSCAQLLSLNRSLNLPTPCQITYLNREIQIIYPNKQIIKKFTLQNEDQIALITQLFLEIEPEQFIYCINAEMLQLLQKVWNGMVERFIGMVRIVGNSQPHHKGTLIRLLKKKGQIVAMVGIPNYQNISLKEADIGLGLTTAQSSTISHFTAPQGNIQSILKLLKFCRAGLATNFQCFKLLCLYSLIQFMTLIILYQNLTTLSNNQLLYVDAIVMGPIFITINLIQPAQILTKQMPPSSLFTRKNLISLFLQCVISLACFLTEYFLLINQPFNQNEYLKNQIYLKKQSQLIQNTYSANSLFIVSNFMYVGVVIGLMVDFSFKKKFYTNAWFILNVGLIWVFNVLIIYIPEEWNLFGLSRNQYWWRVSLIISQIGILLICIMQKILCAFYDS